MYEKATIYLEKFKRGLKKPLQIYYPLVKKAKLALELFYYINFQKQRIRGDDNGGSKLCLGLR